MRKDHVYTNYAGPHWPDTYIGSELYYGIEAADYLRSENDLIQSVEWRIPDGLVQLADIIQGSEAQIKLRATRVGVYTITCFLTTIDGLNTQTNAIKVILKVL